ncbi:hypothetical protein [Rhodococcus sp. Leaf278]|uniref:hypothetical protein n=1 Tax=Rhodococcus sp. Leaf278 TaxID=1736319 RepID=UPI000AF111BB|nr:hypothetical protein [Rhodococcus sp. Leaf278]
MTTIVHDGGPSARGAGIEAGIAARRTEFRGETHETTALALMGSVMASVARAGT